MHEPTEGVNADHRLYKLDADAQEEDAAKKAEVPAELIQFLDGKSFSLVMRKTADDRRGARKVLWDYYDPVETTERLPSCQVGMFFGSGLMMVLSVLDRVIKHHFTGPESASRHQHHSQHTREALLSATGELFDQATVNGCRWM